VFGDIGDTQALNTVFQEHQPEIVLHLAAQPLVRLSYAEPISTYETNVMGTLKVLEAARQCASVKAVVNVTTDKCYENKEWLNSYREDDAMGGYDPYSASKGAAEIAIHAMRRSYFGLPESPVRVASARAGNVIGGGDWALDRIVPDYVRALEMGQAIPVRNKTATRPWQHVLEPLSGYLHLAAALARTSDFPVLEQVLKQPGAATAAFNFGPNLSSNRTVAGLVQEFLRHWPGEWQDMSDPSAPHEATKLNLATDKAFHTLGWQPRWDFATTIAKTVAWYREAESLQAPDDFQNLTRQQIRDYTRP
jgi:CDP-glucose 4,6-dehydratase